MKKWHLSYLSKKKIFQNKKHYLKIYFAEPYI